MKIIIDIPTEVYDRCKEYRLQCGEAEVLEGAVARGTPLLNSKSQINKGYWILHQYNISNYIECSVCKCWFLREHLIRNTYCPNCGDKKGE